MSPTIDAQPVADLITDLAAVCQYRRAFAPSSDPGQWVGPGPAITTRPVGTRDAAYDPIEGASTDSTVDAGTGYVGAYAPAVSVSVLILSTAPAQASYGAYGLQLDENHVAAYMLASDMTPARGDLIIHPDGQRYVVGEDQWALGVAGAEVAYQVILERLNPADVRYAV